MISLEVACGNLASVIAAEKGGAQRIELCSALGVGGLTPSFGFLEAALACTDLPVFAMIRPREGDFLYSEQEVEAMISDIKMARRTGVPGVVFGALTAEGDVDMTICERLLDAAGPMEATFHRAFDLCRDPYESFDRIRSLAFRRLLTSGQAPAAPLGVLLIRELVRVAGDGFTVMAGAGVRSDNVQQLVEQTGVSEVHLSGKQWMDGAMRYRRDHLFMGASGQQEYSLEITDSEQIRAVRTLLDRT